MHNFGMRFAYESSCFLHILLMRFHAFWAATRFSYEISCFLSLMRFPNELSCFLTPIEGSVVRFHAYLLHDLVMRLPYEISCFFAVVRFAYESQCILAA